MTEEEWNELCDGVADEMRNFTRPFVTPLSTETDSVVRLTGTGSYVMIDQQRILLTCEHVANHRPVHYRFFGSEDVFEPRHEWQMARHPIDAAFVSISDEAWEAVDHDAQSIPISKFCRQHKIIQQAEPLFFRGYAGENAHFAFETHETNGTGYCSQEVADTGDEQNFEMFWDPEKAQLTSSTTDEARVEMSFNDPQGFSGSLVWNTRLLEVRAKGKQWSPEDAVITGLLRRWDTKAKTLLVWRVEHLLSWFNKNFVS